MRIEESSRKLRQQHVDHLGVADELHGHEPQRRVDLVLADTVDVTFDRGENEVVDLAHAFEGARDHVRVGEVEPDPSCRATDLARGRFRPGLVPARHDHVTTFVGIGLSELAAEPLRAADDEDAAGCHSLSFRELDRSARPARGGPGAT